MPVPEIARQYYEREDHYLFDKFCTVAESGEGCDASARRRPRLESLYDVFCCVRDDEQEHWKMLCNLVQFDTLNLEPAEKRTESIKATKPAEARGSG